ncbi:MAG: hypothetical protein M1826_006558 [Phylliscum demangeonii]|nr:MAG: hypothetical protein M1826_006558 [Phylliscum demangeonii]
MPNPTVDYEPFNMYESKPWTREGILGLIRAQGPNCATRATVIAGWHESQLDKREHCTVVYLAGDGMGRTSRPATATAATTLAINRGHAATTGQGQGEIDGTADPAYNDAHPGNSVEQGTVNVHRQPLPTPPPPPASPEITTWAATATSVRGIRTRDTAETGTTMAIGRSQDDIYAPAGPPAHNNATLVTSVDQRAVNVHGQPVPPPPPALVDCASCAPKKKQLDPAHLSRSEASREDSKSDWFLVHEAHAALHVRRCDLQVERKGRVLFQTRLLASLHLRIIWLKSLIPLCFFGLWAAIDGVVGPPRRSLSVQQPFHGELLARLAW